MTNPLQFSPSRNANFIHQIDFIENQMSLIEEKLQDITKLFEETHQMLSLQNFEEPLKKQIQDHFSLLEKTTTSADLQEENLNNYETHFFLKVETAKKKDEKQTQDLLKEIVSLKVQEQSLHNQIESIVSAHRKKLEKIIATEQLFLSRKAQREKDLISTMISRTSTFQNLAIQNGIKIMDERIETFKATKTLLEKSCVNFFFNDFS